MTSKVSFSIRASTTGNNKRKRVLHEREELEGDGSGSSSSLGMYFVSAQEAAAEEATDSSHEWKQQRPVKKAALMLEDVATKVKRLQEDGNTLAEADRFRAAMDRWNEALALDAQNAVIYELMAQASMALQDDFEAVQFALKAVHFAPHWGDAHHTLARCHLNFGELELALHNIDKAIELAAGCSDRLASDRREIETLLEQRQRVFLRREVEAKETQDEDKLQVLTCMKHLSLRVQTGN